MLTITLFHTPKVILDGKPVVFPFKRADALLYYMAVEKRATRGELVALLWEECDESTGLKNLRNTLYNIKKNVGEFLLTEQKSVIVLNPSYAFECDYDRFMSDGELSSYTGEFLKGFAIRHSFAFEEWVAGKASALREIYTDKLERQAEEMIFTGDKPAGLSLLKELMRMDPCNENAAVILMQEYGRQESFRKAAEVYTRLKDALLEELGTEPVEKTRTCYYQIMDRWNRNVPATDFSEKVCSYPGPEIFLGEAGEAGKIISMMPEGMPDSVFKELMAVYPKAEGGLKLLLSCGILREEGDGKETAICFQDAEQRRSFYDLFPPEEKEVLHQEILRILREKSESDPENGLRFLKIQYDFCGDRKNALKTEARALYFESERAFVPFSGRYPEKKGGCISAKEALELSVRMMNELNRMKISASEKGEILGFLYFVRGTAFLFSGETEDGINTLGEISGIEGERNDSLLLNVCYVLAQHAIYRQEPDFAERYILTAFRIMERNPGERKMRPQFLRLFGCVLCCKRSYDKANYYLREAIDLIRKIPESPEKRIWLCAAESDMGRVRRYQQGYGDATASFRKALEMLPEGSWPGLTWVYVHYGRTVFALDDHIRAEELFQKAFAVSGDTGETAGRTAAAAYCAYGFFRDKDYEKAAEILEEAFCFSEKCGSPLEKGILAFVSMRIKRELTLLGKRETRLSGILRNSAESYARDGIRILGTVPDVYEAELMKKALRDGIMTRERFKVSELYSKNRRFMTE